MSHGYLYGEILYSGQKKLSKIMMATIQVNRIKLLEIILKPITDESNILGESSPTHIFNPEPECIHIENACFYVHMGNGVLPLYSRRCILERKDIYYRWFCNRNDRTNDRHTQRTQDPEEYFAYSFRQTMDL